MTVDKSPNQTELAAALGMTRSSVSKLKGQGMPVDSLEAAQAWREARQNVAARKRLPSARLDDLNDLDDFDAFGEDRDAARTRRERAEADIAEMNAAKLRRELIRVDAVQAQLATDYATIRDALLQLPPRLAPLLAAEQDAGTVAGLLAAEIHQALLTLSGAADHVPDIDSGFE